jgi:hypothetical protein
VVLYTQLGGRTEGSWAQLMGCTHWLGFWTSGSSNGGGGGAGGGQGGRHITQYNAWTASHTTASHTTASHTTASHTTASHTTASHRDLADQPTWT